MPEPVPIIEIKPGWRGRTEALGSKSKFWFRKDDNPDDLWLYKVSRPDTGEHWAEKVASEIAGLLELPTHVVEFARYDGKIGCAVRSFLESNESLIHGNEVLAGVIPEYDKDKQRGQADHNFANIVQALEARFSTSLNRKQASFRFVGYLMLDALVGNTDRHHENWGVLQHWVMVPNTEGQMTISLHTSVAPTYDHASSLGREMLDERRQRILSEPAGVCRYIKGGKGGIFLDDQARKGLSPLSLVELVAKTYPAFFKPWQKRIAELPPDFANPIIAPIPESYMSAASKQFALAFLGESRKLIASIP